MVDKDAASAAPPTEEVAICPLCGSSVSNLLFPAFDRYYKLPGKFRLVECGECELVRLSPRPVIGEIGFYYPTDEYYSYQESGTLKDRGFLNRAKLTIRNAVLHHQFGYPTESGVPAVAEGLIGLMFFQRGSYSLGRRLPRYVKNGRALDIGCGSAAFLNILKTNGWRVVGVDLSNEASETAMKQFEIEVSVGPVESAGFAPLSFDYIHMSHSIEHLPDPVDTLRTVSQLLKSGGRLYIETPNIGSRNFRRLREYWMPLETPRHLYLFSPTTLRASVEKAGLVIEKQETSYRSFDDFAHQYKLESFEGESVQAEYHGQNPLRAATDKLRSHLQQLYNDDQGDFLHCWAVKPKS